MAHAGFPGIDAFQLEAGPLEGWIYSAMVGCYRVTAGCCNRAILYEGIYNLDMLHIGFILNPEHSAVVQAHEYNAASVSVDFGAVPMHDIFPANMAWANISAPEKTLMQGVPYSKNQFTKTPHLMLTHSRSELLPLIDLINQCIDGSAPNAIEGHLQAALHSLLSSRFNTSTHKQPFAEGNLHRMHLIKETHKLALSHKHQPLSLDEICAAVGMKPRTVQKYFHEIYGMGPTEYFRVRRLNGARADLLNGAASVSEVALRWEFTHLGRFAGSYKTLFGESPKTTLDRSIS